MQTREPLLSLLTPKIRHITSRIILNFITHDQYDTMKLETNMKSVPEILHLTALELSHHLGCGKITATRLMAETLDRIDDINPSVRAIVALRDRKRLMEEAYAADLELKNYIDGKSTDEKNFEKRWLLGIPIAIKDISHAKGFPTTMGGCTLYGEELLPNGHDAANSMNSTDAEQDGKYHVFGIWKYKSQTEDDPYVKRLRDAGAIVIGKTNGETII